MSNQTKRRKGQDDARTRQRELYELATNWHAGLELGVAGVDVASIFTYPVMQALVSMELQRAQKVQQVQQEAAGV